MAVHAEEREEEEYYSINCWRIEETNRPVGRDVVEIIQFSLATPWLN